MKVRGGLFRSKISGNAHEILLGLSSKSLTDMTSKGNFGKDDEDIGHWRNSLIRQHSPSELVKIGGTL